MMEQCREPLLLVLPRSFPHTMQSLGHPLPALRRLSVRFHDVLLGHRPSLHHLRRRVFPALFGSFAGSPPVFDSSLTCMPGLRFWLPGPTRFLVYAPGVGEVSRFSRVQFLDVRLALGLRRACRQLAFALPPVWPSRWEHS